MSGLNAFLMRCNLRAVSRDVPSVRRNSSVPDAHIASSRSRLPSGSIAAATIASGSAVRSCITATAALPMSWRGRVFCRGTRK